MSIHKGRRTWVRLHRKGGKRHEMPCHRNLDSFLHEFIEAAALTATPKGGLFTTSAGRTGLLTDRPMSQAVVYRMIRRRAAATSIIARIGCHTVQATGITEYLRNGAKLEVAKQMENHESGRTTDPS